MILTLCSKRTFCGAKKLSFCASETVLKFTCGVGMKADVLQNCGCEPAVKMLTSLRKVHEQCIAHAEIKIKSETQQRRQK